LRWSSINWFRPRWPDFSAFVSKHGYSSIFFLFAGFTVIYFLTAVFLLPETKGKTLEESKPILRDTRPDEVMESREIFSPRYL